MSLAPIVLFCYNRTQHLQRVVNSLLANVEAGSSNLIIYSDGARQAKDEASVNEVRAYIHQISGFPSIRIVEQPINLGLAENVIRGVTEIVAQYGKVIVVEDDMEVAPYFLSFMNDALVRYENDDRVACICGYLYPVKKQLPDSFFIYGADCGAWGTWNKQWQLFEPDGKKILNIILQNKWTWRFNFDGSYPYIKMLEDQIAGRNNSWAVRWYGAAFIKNKLTLYPGKSLAQDIGWDNSGVHCASDDSHNVELYLERISVNEIPVEHNKRAYLAFKEFFISLNNLSRFKQIRKRFKRWVKYRFTGR